MGSQNNLVEFKRVSI